MQSRPTCGLPSNQLRVHKLHTRQLNGAPHYASDLCSDRLSIGSSDLRARGQYQDNHSLGRHLPAYGVSCLSTTYRSTVAALRKNGILGVQKPLRKHPPDTGESRKSSHALIRVAVFDALLAISKSFISFFYIYYIIFLNHFSSFLKYFQQI